MQTELSSKTRNGFPRKPFMTPSFDDSIKKAQNYYIMSYPIHTSLTSTSSPSEAIQRNLSQFPRMPNKEQAIFIFFIRYLCYYLETIASEPLLALRVKSTIRECVLMNRSGNPSFRPLKKVILLSIRRCIGDEHWVQGLAFVRMNTRNNVEVTRINRTFSFQGV